TGDTKMEIVAAAGSHIFAWTADGQPLPADTTDGELTGVFKSNITACFASPSLADLDGDGKAEIIVFDQTTQTIRAWHGDGRGVGNPDGTIAQLPPAPATPNTTASDLPLSIVAAAHNSCAGVSVAALGPQGFADFFIGTYWIRYDL